MTYRMKNWDFLRDIMCSNDFIAEKNIEGAMKDIKVPLSKRDVDGLTPINKMIDNCKCTSTRDGLEACINVWRGDLSHTFRSPGQNPAFESFLKALDDRIGKIRKQLAEEHAL